MNRLTLALVAIAASVSGVAASLFTVLLLGATQPEPVQAAPEVPAPAAPIRIAVVNLEEVSRNSPLFEKCMSKWDSAREDTRTVLESEEREYGAIVRRLNFAQSKNNDREEILSLQIRARSYEEALNAMRHEYADYLERLLAQYQREVLQDVLANVKRYTAQEGFQLVLQDYTLDENVTDFANSDYAETLLAKPVVDAPGMSSGANTHVTDITQVIIEHMRKGGVPEKDD